MKKAAIFWAIIFVGNTYGSKAQFTPLQWQGEVKYHPIDKIVGQRKNKLWVRDLNRNFIDDEIEKKFKSGERVNIIVDFNRSLVGSEIARILGGYGRLTYVGRLLTLALVNDVPVERLPELAAHGSVAMIEWQAPIIPMEDVAGRAIQARSSISYSPHTAEDLKASGAGVGIAILDSGVDERHESLVGSFRAGFNALTLKQENPSDDSGHGTLVASIALGRGRAGRVCRRPDDGSPSTCAGIAPEAQLIDVKVCEGHDCPNESVIAGIEWIAEKAVDFNIRVANLSIGSCDNDDGTSALAEEVNALSSLGISVVVAYGNASNCKAKLGEQLSGAPGSASSAITVQASNDKGTILRGDDVIFRDCLKGPRKGFNANSPNILALKPDISAPGENIVGAKKDTISAQTKMTGTSMATPMVSGAAAIIIQAHPEIDPGSLKQLLRSSADTSRNGRVSFPKVDAHWNDRMGAGIVNVFGALHHEDVTDVGFPSCVGPPLVPGGPCIVSGPLKWSNDKDIKLMNPIIAVGRPNKILASVGNFGASAATVMVNFGVYNYSVGARRVFDIGTISRKIMPGETVVVKEDWTPASVRDLVLQVNIIYGGDKNFANNVTQKTLTSSSFERRVRIENQLGHSIKIRLLSKGGGRRWTCEVGSSEITLSPFGVFDIPVWFRVKPEFSSVKLIGSASCEVLAEAVASPDAPSGVRLLGGVDLKLSVPRPCGVSGQLKHNNGEPVRDSTIKFLSAFPRALVYQARTDKRGRFSINMMPGVRYRFALRGTEEVEYIFSDPVACGRKLEVFRLTPLGTIIDEGIKKNNKRSGSRVD